jgi:group I intron endonuclease
MDMGIYKIENKINGKIYIGSSKHIEERFKEHKGLLKNNKHHSKHLQNAWNKYGEENFKFEVLELIQNRLLLKSKEQEYALKYSSLNPNHGYNIAPISEQTMYLIDNKDSYVFMWNDIIVYKNGNIIKDNELDIFEKAFLYTIIPLIDPISYRVVYKEECPTHNTLAQLSNMSPRKMYQVIQGLETKKLIRRMKNGLANIIYVNPYYLKVKHLSKKEKLKRVNTIEDMVVNMFN